MISLFPCLDPRPQKHHISAPADPPFLAAQVDRYYIDRLAVQCGGVHPMKGLPPQCDSIRLRTNDYLCLAQHPLIIAAEVQALQQYGHGESVSRIWNHHLRDSLHVFEKRVATHMNAQAAVLCNSGYCANVGLVQAIAAPNTPVYLDMKAHMSLWEGVKSAQARAIPFRHNDVNNLLRLIKKNGPGIVIVDAVYSIDGDICPISDLVTVVEESGCVLVVDETHSFGVQGENGEGIVASAGFADRVHFRTVGLSKAIASRGGLVITSDRNAEFLRYEALPIIFSTTVLPHEVAGYNAALDVIVAEPWRRTALHRKHRRLKNEIDDLGYNVDACKTQILALEAGDIHHTIKLRDALESRGVFGSVFFPPATPEKRSIIRFTVNCLISEAEIDRVVEVCRDISLELNVKDWASSKRKSRLAKRELPDQAAA